MPAPPTMTPDELAHLVRQHAHSLRAAGVTFLPAATSLSVAVVSAPEPMSVSSLELPIIQDVPPPDPFQEATTPVVLSVHQRGEQLQELRQRVAVCERCPQLAAKRKQTVFGVGPLDPELCFVGEAPGYEEDQRGEPFVGPAGQLLTKIIAAMGMKREEVYICNVLRCRPPGNRAPSPEEAANCREYLERTLELIRPKYLCALGACAAQNLLGTTTSISRLRGRFHDLKNIPLLCTFHPSYLLRAPERKKEVWEDMKMLLAKMGRPVPKR